MAQQTRIVDSPSRGVLAATVASVTVIAHLVAAKAARDGLFLSGYEVALLPRMMVLGALVSLAAAFISARVMQRVAPARLLLAALGVSAVWYWIEWALIDSAPREVALLLYVHVSAFGATLVAALWSLVNERFDPHTAKQEIARVALGGSLGGVLGGIAGWLVSGARGLSLLLVMLGVLNLLTMGAVLSLTRSARLARVRPRPEPTDRMSAFRALRDSPYLATLATLVALSAFSSALLDYVLSARVVAARAGAADLAAFFALFHASVGLAAMVVQITLTRISLERLGLGGTVALVPGAVLSVGVLALAVPQVWSAVVLRGSEALVQASLSRSAYELLYTPLPRAQKRPTKMLIDVGVDRLGTMAGGALTALMVAALPGLGKRTFVALAMGISIGALFCAARLNRGYVEALAGRLRRGGMKLDPRNVLDATTRRTLAGSTALDRRMLLDAIELQRRGNLAGEDDATRASDVAEGRETVLVGPSGAGFEAAPGYVALQLGAAGRFRSSERPHLDDALVDSILELRSGDADRIRSVLLQPLEPELAVHVVPLLGRDEIARDVLQALRGVADRVTGTLSDALLDSAGSVIVRRRIPRVLERCPTARAIGALVDGLFDRQPDVRNQCALALLRMIELDPSAQLPRERIVDAIERELSEEFQRVSASYSADTLDVQQRFGEERVWARAQPRVEHVMTLIALLIEPEPVRLAYHAIYGDDPAIRGTALEYLDNVLPERLKAGVLSLFEGSPARVSRRPRRELPSLIEELLRSRERAVPSR